MALDTKVLDILAKLTEEDVVELRGEVNTLIKASEIMRKHGVDPFVLGVEGLVDNLTDLVYKMQNRLRVTLPPQHCPECKNDSIAPDDKPKLVLSETPGWGKHGGDTRIELACGHVWAVPTQLQADIMKRRVSGDPLPTVEL